MALPEADGSELSWAERVSRRLLEPLGGRWLHSFGVAERARAVGDALEQREHDVLVAAAFVHDIGYAPELAQTGFHPLDGARFVRAAGRERLAGLVAFHSGAEVEADERGLLAELADFEAERSLVSRMLTYCDLTTDREGRPVAPEVRLAEIRERYGESAPESRTLERSEDALLDAVRALESELADNRDRRPAVSDSGRRRMP